MLIMAERESRLPYYIAGEFEGIAVLEATTSGLQMLMYGREAQDMDSQPCHYSEVRGTQ